MITEKAYEAFDKARKLHHEVFGDCRCVFDMCRGGKPTIINANEDRKYAVPEGETDQSFIARIERSISAEKNLFLDEYKEIAPIPQDPSILY